MRMKVPMQRQVSDKCGLHRHTSTHNRQAIQTIHVIGGCVAACQHAAATVSYGHIVQESNLDL